MSAQYVVLSGIGYNVSVIDRQVIFDSANDIYGFKTRFAFERPVDINESGGIWYLCSLESTTGRVPASHLVAALDYCKKEFGASFEAYKGALAL